MTTVIAGLILISYAFAILDVVFSFICVVAFVIGSIVLNVANFLSVIQFHLRIWDMDLFANSMEIATKWATTVVICGQILILTFTSSRAWQNLLPITIMGILASIFWTYIKKNTE